MTNFEKVNPKQSFPEIEENIINFWKENDTFKKSIENRANSEEFNFYDGPPFATGTPHYGHILAGAIKDVIPRYQTMTGKKVERRFGWDTHGLPIENIVEKKLEISGKEDIEQKIGVHCFNETCRENVFGFVDEWKKTVKRMGRWVDMEDDYKTMDTNFMESIWWVFKTIYDKGLIYEGNRIVPYCPRCTTPLSNFEVNQGYKDKQDKTVTVKFRIVNTNTGIESTPVLSNKYILAWTTTPWTLYANLGLAVGEDIMYAEILDKKNGETYILASDLIKNYYKQPKNNTGVESTPVLEETEEYKIIREYKGSCLAGIQYEPLFDDFKIQLEDMGADLGTGISLGKNSYSVVIGHHVTTESGTGIVHIAPAYGEDDNIIGKEKDLGFVAHVNDAGKTYNLLDDNKNNKFIFDFNEQVISELKEKKVSIHIGTINHSYPHCWRCDTPLIYRAISAWYVDVTAIKDKMIANNKKINWVPEEIKNGRMGKWLEGARDWNISRNRYWGSAIPVWQNEDKTEEVCIGSIKELYELNKDFGQIEKKGEKYFYTNTGKEIDLHKHFVDEILVKNPETGNTLKRIPEVLDCWFESGSMPYASKHFMGTSPQPSPLEERELEQSSKNSPSPQGEGAGGGGLKFPANFIAEGLDQTRGWFYTLLILGTALFENTPFLNCIVNGIILAEDGKKMSKSLQNYPAPELIFDKYGADAMRFYLLNSPVVEADDFRFAENGVEEVVKKVILPLWNTYYFFTTYANIDNFTPSPSKEKVEVRSNKLDSWIISELNELTKDVSSGFDAYKLRDAASPIVKFMDNLTNWYIRRSRKRFWKSENDGDKLEAYETLYFVLVELTKIIAPFMPFISEHIYKNLTGKESVHLEDFPTYNENLIDEKLNAQTDKIQKIITLGLAFRANQKIRVRQALQSLTITENFEDYFKEILKEELNVKEILVVNGETLAKKVCKPNGRNIGPKFGKDVKFIMSEAKSGNFKELENGNVLISPSNSPLSKGGETEIPLLDKEGLGEVSQNSSSPKQRAFILEKGDFELVFEAEDSEKLIETGFGMVISMDTKITEELKQEGFARDLVRYIQEARKEAGYNVEDRIKISIKLQEKNSKLLENFGKYIETETLSHLQENLKNTDFEKKIEIEGEKVKISLKK